MIKGKEMTAVIDNEKCIGCGSCITVCADDAIEIIDGNTVITRDESS